MDQEYDIPPEDTYYKLNPTGRHIKREILLADNEGVNYQIVRDAILEQAEPGEWFFYTGPILYGRNVQDELVKEGILKRAFVPANPNNVYEGNCLVYKLAKP